jgi:hypothetical protein
MDRFFEGKSKVHAALRRIVKRLEKAKIPYAILGGMALNAHRYQRMTTDVDVLLTPEGLAAFREKHIEMHYQQLPKRPRRFVDRANGVTIDVLVTGLFPGTGQPGPIPFPDPATVGKAIDRIRYVDLKTLIELKLAARRWRDFADVVELIRFNHLDESFLKQLHPSVHADFVECLEEKRREDEYEARNG